MKSVQRVSNVSSDLRLIGTPSGIGAEACPACAAAAIFGFREDLFFWLNVVSIEIPPLREVGQRAAMEAEREAIERVLFRTNWNRKEARFSAEPVRKGEERDTVTSPRMQTTLRA